ncbi:Hsp70 family protein [Cryptosporangium minutisporangium]|uniref:Hsp70 family protein n=1 Tax=Cryptosporangium minutisporangium TaxID=113569 RepID=A0ABP6T8U1_9ACTN
MPGPTSDPAAAGGDHLLGVDLGLTNTVALVRRPDGRTAPLLFDGEPVLPSGVLLDADGIVRVGRDAERRAADDPDHFEPTPRRHIGEQKFRLGVRDTTPTDLLAAVLAAVAEAATATIGTVPPAVLTHPVTWTPAEQDTYRRAAGHAGFAAVTLVTEPVAAAVGAGIPGAVGGRLVVVDVGARRFDVSVVRREPERFAVVAIGGDPTIGGRRVDAAIAAHLAATAGRQRREIWRAIDRPRTADDRRVQRAFWAEVGAAKSALGLAESVPVAVPGLADSPLTRSDLERYSRPLADRVVRVTARVLREVGIRPSELDAVVLVGGSAPLPTLAPALHEALGIEPVRVEQPAFAVVGGALGQLAADVALPPGIEPVTGAARPPIVVPTQRRPAAAAVLAGVQVAVRFVRRPKGAITGPPRRTALPGPRRPDGGLPVRRRPGSVSVFRRPGIGPAHRDPTEPSARLEVVWHRFGWLLALGGMVVVLIAAMVVLLL